MASNTQRSDIHAHFNVVSAPANQPQAAPQQSAAQPVAKSSGSNNSALGGNFNVVQAPQSKPQQRYKPATQPNKVEQSAVAPIVQTPAPEFQATFDRAKNRSSIVNSASEFVSSSISSFMGLVNWAAGGLASTTDKNNQSTQWLRDFASSVDASADKWEQKTAAYNAAATQDMGKVGILIHDLAINALPMLVDAGVAALLVADDVTGVGAADDPLAVATAAKAASRGSKIWNAIKAFGLHADDVKAAREVVSKASMAARVFGQEYNSREDSMAKGHATLRAGMSAAIEVGTEMIFGMGLPGMAYGKGVKSIEDAATRTAAKVFKEHEILAGFALSMLGEGSEEVLSDLGNAAVDYAFQKCGVAGEYDELTFESVMYDFLIGGLLGCLGAPKNISEVHAVNNPEQQKQAAKNQILAEARQAADDGLEKGAHMSEAAKLIENGALGGDLEEASEKPSEAQNGSTQQQTQATPVESDTAQARLLKTEWKMMTDAELLSAYVSETNPDVKAQLWAEHERRTNERFGTKYDGMPDFENMSQQELLYAAVNLKDENHRAIALELAQKQGPGDLTSEIKNNRDSQEQPQPARKVEAKKPTPTKATEVASEQTNAEAEEKPASEDIGNKGKYLLMDSNQLLVEAAIAPSKADRDAAMEVWNDRHKRESSGVDYKSMTDKELVAAIPFATEEQRDEIINELMSRNESKNYTKDGNSETNTEADVESRDVKSEIEGMFDYDSSENTDKRLSKAKEYDITEAANDQKQTEAQRELENSAGEGEFDGMTYSEVAKLARGNTAKAKRAHAELRRMAAQKTGKVYGGRGAQSVAEQIIDENINHSSTNTKPKYSGSMSFKYGSDGIFPNVKSTLEAIKLGLRTSTTRFEKDGNINYWKKVKAGELIRFHDKDGNFVDVRVTVPLHKIDPSTFDVNEWMRKEGWGQKFVDTQLMPELDQAWQMEYELVSENELQQAKNSDTNNDYTKSEEENNNGRADEVLRTSSGEPGGDNLGHGETTPDNRKDTSVQRKAEGQAKDQGVNSGSNKTGRGTGRSRKRLTSAKQVHDAIAAGETITLDQFTDYIKPKGTTPVRVKHPTEYTELEKKTSDSVLKKTGKTVLFIEGDVVTSEGTKTYGTNLGGTDIITLKAGMTERQTSRISKHEVFHAISESNPGLLNIAISEIKHRLGDNFNDAATKYISSLYSSNLSAKDYPVATKMPKIVKEEMCADFYGNTSLRYGINADDITDDFAAKVDKLAVRKYGEKSSRSNGGRSYTEEKAAARERVKDLFTVHSLTTKNLVKTILSGKIVAPSTAISKLGVVISSYGECYLLFNKDSIDPQLSEKNKVYNRDANTPTRAMVEYDGDGNILVDGKPTTQSSQSVMDSMFRHGNRGGKSFDSVSKAIESGNHPTYNQMVAKSATEYDSIDEIIEDSGRIKELTDEDDEEAIAVYNRLSGVYDMLDKAFAKRGIDKFENGSTPTAEYKDFLWKIYNAAEAKSVDDVVATFDGKISKSLAEKYFDVIEALRALPTGYFEGKGERIYGLNEIATAVIPDTTPTKLISELERKGIPVVTYDEYDDPDEVVFNAADVYNTLFYSEMTPEEQAEYEQFPWTFNDLPEETDNSAATKQEAVDSINSDADDNIKRMEKIFGGKMYDELKADASRVIKTTNDIMSRISGGVEEKKLASNDKFRTEKVRQFGDKIAKAVNGEITFSELADYYESIENDRVNGMFWNQKVNDVLQKAKAAEERNSAMSSTTSVENFAKSADRAIKAITSRVEKVAENTAYANEFSEAVSEKYKINKDDPTWKKMAKKVANFFASYQFNPTTVFKHAFGYDKDSLGYKIAKKIDDAVADRQIIEATAQENFADIYKREDFYEFATGKMETGTLENLNGKSISMLEAASIIKTIDTLGGPGSHRVAALNGFEIGDKLYSTQSRLADGSKNPDAVNLHKLYRELISKMNDVTEEYMSAYDKMTSFYKPKLEEKSKEVNGYVEQMFEEGNYFSVFYAGENEDVMWSIEHINDRGITGTRYMQERSKTDGGVIKIKPITEVADSYMRTMSNYLAFSSLGQQLDIMNTQTAISPSIGDVMGEHIDPSFKRFMDNYVKDVNMFYEEESADDVNSLLKNARLHLQNGALLFSPSVQMKQVSSFWAAMGVLSPESLIATWRFKELTAKGNSKDNPIVKYRLLGNIDPTLTDVFNSDKTIYGRMKMKSKAFNDFANLTNIKDYRTVDNLYDATVFDVKLNNPDIDVNSEEFSKLVEAKFNEVVIRTQPIFTKQARAEYARTNNELVRMTSMFRTQQTQNLNLMVTAIGEYVASKGSDSEADALKTLKHTIAGQATSAMSLALLSVAADMLLHRLKKYDDDDDGEIDASGVFKRIGLNAVETAAGTVWFGDSAMKYVIDALSKGETNEFYGVNMGIVSSIGSALDSVQNFIEKPTRTNARYAAGYISQMFGLPLNNAYAMLNSAIMYTKDITGSNPEDYDDILKFLDGETKKEVKEQKREAQILETKKATAMTDAGVEDDVAVKIYNAVQAAQKEAQTSGYYNGWSVMDVILDLDTTPADIDGAASAYLTEKQYGTYDTLRNAGLNPKEAVSTFKDIDADDNNSLKQAEVFDYFVQNPAMEDIAIAIWNSYGWKTSWETYKKKHK